MPDKSLEFLLFSGDYDGVIARSSVACDVASMPAQVGALALSGRLDEAESVFRGLERSAEALDAVLEGRFFLIAGLCHAGHVDKALRLLGPHVSALPRTAGRSRFWIWQGVALVRFFEGRFRRARAAARRALASAVQASFPYARVLALDLMAHVLMHTGELHAGARLLEQAASLAAVLGYEDNTRTLRTSAVVYELSYLLAPIEEATQRAESALAQPGVSYFARRNGLIELATAWALRGEAARASAALEEARRIALPGSDRRAKTRWLIAQGLCCALSRGPAAAREIFDEARVVAAEQTTLVAELGFAECLFVGPSDTLRATLPEVARASGIARAQVALGWLRARELPAPTQLEDGLCRVLSRCRRAPPTERVNELLRAGLLGLLPWALELEPGRRLILTSDHLITEDHGTVARRAAPTGPSRRLLEVLGGGFQSREDLVQTVWGLGRYNAAKHAAVVNTAMSRLRPALADSSWVVTHESGYHLAEGVELVILADASAAPRVNAPSAPPAPLEETKVLEHLAREGPSSSAEVARALRMSPSSALRLLRRLVTEGRVARAGTGRATRYELPKP